MHAPFSQILTSLLVAATATTLHAQNPAVLTGEYDNNRTTTNNSELVLSPATVSASTFGKIGSWSLDGQVVGQPLYVPGVGKGAKAANVLYVATMNNSVYAFDADTPGSTPLWQVNLGPAVPVNYAGTCPANFATGKQLGILSTPVIDDNSKTLYVVAAHPIPDRAAYSHTLYALDISTGAQKHGGSVIISGSVSGSGTASVNGKLSIGPTTTNLIQRPALLLSNGTVYAGFSGCGPDPSPYHGWVAGYSAANLQQQTLFNTTPDGDEGGIWQGGRGLVADSQGSIYFESGNGTYDGQPDFGESFVKLSSTGRFRAGLHPRIHKS